MSNALLITLGVVAIAATCCFAFAKGGAPERGAATWVLATWLLGSAAQMFLPTEALPLVALSADGALAIALLFISIQYASLWLGAAMLVQSTAFSLHAWFLTAEPHSRNGYIAAVNALGLVLIALLIGSTLARWRTRVRRRAGLAASGGPLGSALA